MAPILVAYTTNSGSTEEVARAVGEELGKNGSQVDVLRLEEVSSLEPYDAVVIGAPLIMGWHRAAVRFIKKHQTALSQVPVAYFFTAMSLTQTHESQLENTPVWIDPDLVQEPKDPGRLSFKENYATLSNYLGKALKAAPAIKPVSAGFFGGKLELFRLPFFQMLFVMLIIRAQPGDRRNWENIQGWAARLREEMLVSDLAAQGKA
jgi:menaquinone-dependent protoporphyrinogen oxidase